MAKPDLFRMFGCVVMVTLIIVIAVKLSKQCMPSVRKTASLTPKPAHGGSPEAGKGQMDRSSSPSAKKSDHQGHGVCQAGFRPDQNGFCVEDY